MRPHGRLSAARRPISTYSCPVRIWVAAERRTISRRRRRTLLRSTAFPTLFDTVRPNRAGPSSRRLRACSTNAADGALIPDAAARKSARCLNRSMEAMRGLLPLSGRQPFATAPPARRQDFAPALGRHACAEAVAALTYKLARLVGPLHVRSPLAAPWGRRD